MSHKRNTQYTFRDHINPMRDMLAERFPKSFRPAHCKNRRKKVLKLGIYNDIVAEFPEIDKGLLKCVLRDYTTGVSYLRAVKKPNAWRVDLNGKPVQRVSKEHRDFAEEYYPVRLEQSRKHYENMRQTKKTLGFCAAPGNPHVVVFQPEPRKPSAPPVQKFRSHSHLSRLLVKAFRLFKA